MRKSKLYERLLTPFTEKRRMDFPDFVKAFTAGITRMHIGNYFYSKEDFFPASWEFYKQRCIVSLGSEDKFPPNRGVPTKKLVLKELPCHFGVSGGQR